MSLPLALSSATGSHVIRYVMTLALVDAVGITLGFVVPNMVIVASVVELAN